MKTIVDDLRYGARSLAKSAPVSLVIVATLALAIGANTAIFSVVDAVLIRRLPYPEPDRLVVVWEKKDADEHNVVGPSNFLAWRDESGAFDRLAAFMTTRATVTGIGEPEDVTAQFVSEDFFPALAVPPWIGRTFDPRDCTIGAPPTVILRHAYWQSRFAANPAVVGSKMTVNGRSAEIIGVMPPGFDPRISENASAHGAPELWGALAFRAEDRQPRGRSLSVMGRLRDGIDLTQARERMNLMASRLADRFPAFDSGWGITVLPLREQLAGKARPILLLLLASVGMVLLIACANVANLLLARSTARTREIAIRSALGASRARIVRLLVVEALLLSFAGGAVGLALAAWGADALAAAAPAQMLESARISMNWRIALFALVASVATGILFGLAPAREASRVDLSDAMKSAGAQGGVRHARRLREIFVVSQVALSLVLLVGSGLLVRSLVKLGAVDPGFDRARLLTFQLTFPRARYGDAEKVVPVFADLVERVRGVPGVLSAGLCSALPFGGPGSATDFAIEGRPPQPPGQDLITDVRMVDPGYFGAMGIPLLQGRNFDEHETRKASGVVIVSRALVRRHFPGEDPIGKRIVIDMKDQNTPSEIVGIVADVRGAGLDLEPQEMVYWPQAELPQRRMSIVVRAQGDPRALLDPIRRIVRGLDPDLAPAEVRTMDDLVATSIERTRFSSLLLSLFSGVAALIACVGIHGVMSYTVAHRAREIGIRMALGAVRGDVLRMVLGRGLRLALAGALAGCVLAAGLTRLLVGFLFATSPYEPAVFASLAALLTFVVLAACWGPARRAAGLDPQTTLRQD